MADCVLGFLRSSNHRIRMVDLNTGIVLVGFVCARARA